MENRIFHKILCIIAITFIVIAIILRFLKCLPEESMYGISVSSDVAVCLATVINAFLLYETLNSQNRSFKQERFETTYFNLLENHRKIVKRMFLTPKVYEDEIKDIRPEHFCFIFARNEQLRIKEALLSERYQGQYDEDVDEKDIINRQTYRDMYQELTKEEEESKDRHDKQEIAIKYTNRIYNISQKDYDKYRQKNEEEKDVLVFDIFMRRWKLYFEQYMNSLRCVTSLLKDKGKDSDYLKFLQTEISWNERDFLRKLLIRTDYDDFRTDCEKCGLTEWLNKNQNNKE